MIATFKHNILQNCNILLMFGHPVATCCDILGVVHVGSTLTQHPTTKMSQEAS